MDNNFNNSLSQAGKAPKTPRFYEGSVKLNKSGTKDAWTEFGGDKLAVFEPDGSAYILRVIERESRKNLGIYFKLVEKLIRKVDGYGSIAWRLDLGAVVCHKPTMNKFDEAWAPAILNKVHEVVVNGVPSYTASKALADELGVSFRTMRANLWIADKWARGETSSFLPHRSMIRPIFDLLCELGKKDMALSSMRAYCTQVTKPSEHVLTILREEESIQEAIQNEK